jgi:SAM-dependent methyltransferase
MSLSGHFGRPRILLACGQAGVANENQPAFHPYDPRSMGKALRFDESVRLRLSPWVGRDIRVLEAGCGFRSPVEFGDHAYVVGLDIDKTAVRRNDKLDEALVGDLQTYPLPAEAFDLIFCRFVLEHLQDPERALENMRRALKPGGWLTLMFPNRWSLKGVVARLTPQVVHDFGYRVVFGKGWATTHKTYFHPAVSVGGIRHFAEREKLRIVAFDAHPGDLDWLIRKHSPFLGGLWLVAERVVQVLTLGRSSPKSREFIAILADARPERLGPSP